VMEVDTDFLITNYKISCCFSKFPKEFSSKLAKDQYTKQHGNFFVFRPKVKFCVFIIFPRSGFVNITGLKKEDKFPEAINLFLNHFQLNSRLTSLKIDNITACSKIRKFANIEVVEQILLSKKEKLLSIKFNSYIFPSLYLKIKEKGTIIIFNSGKFNIVGLSCQSKIKDQISILSALINR